MTYSASERRRKNTYLVARESEDDEAAVFEFLIQRFETLVLGSESTVDKAKIGCREKNL